MEAVRGAPETVPEGSREERRAHLVPYAGVNPIRFNGIRQLPISAPQMGHPDKNPASLINRQR
jgi:hypothetical protein